MILSVSRRTDVPNYYSDWFLRRIREGFLYVSNPVNPHQISRIHLSPELVDCIVFWTKNPVGIINRLEELQSYQYYFQYTITGYGRDIEPNLPDKKACLIPAFQRLSGMLGMDRVIWRYDPILLNERYTWEYHINAFSQIARSLKGYTEHVVISFLDLYAKTKKNTRGMNIKIMNQGEMTSLVGRLAAIAAENHMTVQACCGDLALKGTGLFQGSCIDKRLIEKLLGCRVKVSKDPNQRVECGCAASIDVGAYDTCLNGCRYCYANFNSDRVKANAGLYDVNSPLLCKNLGPEDKVTERKAISLKEEQLSLF